MINSDIIKQCLLALLSQDAGTHAENVDLLIQDKLTETAFGECLIAHGYSIEELFIDKEMQRTGVGGTDVKVPPAKTIEVEGQTLRVGGTGVRNPPTRANEAEVQMLEVGGSGVRNPP